VHARDCARLDVSLHLGRGGVLGRRLALLPRRRQASQNKKKKSDTLLAQVETDPALSCLVWCSPLCGLLHAGLGVGRQARLRFRLVHGHLNLPRRVPSRERGPERRLNRGESPVREKRHKSVRLSEGLSVLMVCDLLPGLVALAGDPGQDTHRGVLLVEGVREFLPEL